MAGRLVATGEIDMLLTFNVQEMPDWRHDVCVVGAGPVGIALALALSDGGNRVLLLDAGDESDKCAGVGHHIVDPASHAASAVAMRRGFGGTSRWWGGRLVPFDPIDFVARDHISSACWPIGKSDVLAYEAAAARYFGVPGIASKGLIKYPDGDNVKSSDTEAWAPNIDMFSRHHDRLIADENIRMVGNAEVISLALSDHDDAVGAITIRSGDEVVTLVSPRLVLAGGGIETTRLLLETRNMYPDALGRHEGALGHYYMGHASGRIADIVFNDPADASEFDFVLEDEGFYSRRRLTITADAQRRELLPNICFWADNPRFADDRHGVGLLSLVWMALASPPIGRRILSEGVRLSHVGTGPHHVGRHIRNILTSPLSTSRDLIRVLRGRYLGRIRRPGFLLSNSSGRYAMNYHAEQRPNRDSCIRVKPDPASDRASTTEVDLRYSDEDFAGILRAHDVLDDGLRASGLGRLEYHVPPDERMAAIRAQATDGFHQIGSARMGDDPAGSVVDRNLRVHGLDNLWVASSAVFPTSGQANPTFHAVALALRLADHLTTRIRESNRCAKSA